LIQFQGLPLSVDCRLNTEVKKETNKMQTTNVVTNNNRIQELSVGFGVSDVMIKSIQKKLHEGIYRSMQSGNKDLVKAITEATTKVQSTSERPRIQPVEGLKLCMDCYREGIAQGMTEEEARIHASHEEEKFVKVGKAEDGTQRYGSYCQRHNNVRAAANKAKNESKVRATKLPALIAKAESRVATLTVDLSDATSVLEALLNEQEEAKLSTTDEVEENQD
jgi:hypothetical protein